MRDAAASNSLSIDRYELLRGEQKDVRIPDNPLLPINGVPVVPPLKTVEDPDSADLSASTRPHRPGPPQARQRARTDPSQNAMASRHPLPYTYARAHTVLLEDEGDRLVLWAPETVSLSALAEVLRLYDVDALEREAASTLANRIAVAYAGSESSAATVIGEVESAVDLSRMMQELPAIEDLLEASNDAPIIRMLNALLTQAAKDGASDIHIEPYERSSSGALFASTARCARWCSPTRRCTRR